MTYVLAKAFSLSEVIIKCKFSLSPLHVCYHKCRVCAFLSISPIPSPKSSTSLLARLLNAHGERLKPACNWCSKGGPLGIRRPFFEFARISNGAVLSHKAQCWEAPKPCRNPTLLGLVLNPASLQRRLPWVLSQVQPLSTVGRATTYII